jgi:hypothetical protein
MKIKNYNYEDKQITAICTDTYEREYLWIGFEAVDGVCKLLKVSANNPLIIYSDVSITADRIIKIIDLSDTYIYLFIEDSEHLAVRVSKANPITNSTYYDRPVGITEDVIDAFADSTYVYCLFPGIESGTNASIYRATISTQFLELIDLVGVTNLNSFAIDNNDDIWGVIYETPGQLIRVFLG